MMHHVHNILIGIRNRIIIIAPHQEDAFVNRFPLTVNEPFQGIVRFLRHLITDRYRFPARFEASTKGEAGIVIRRNQLCFVCSMTNFVRMPFRTWTCFSSNETNILFPQLLIVKGNKRIKHRFVFPNILR
ncbi:hypothetical protein D3C81_1533990 [compost metagenome]